MNRKLHTLLIIILSVYTFSCGEDVSLQEPINIDGEWEWVSSSGGIAGHTIKPGDDGRLPHNFIVINDEIDLRVDNDSENGLTILLSDISIKFNETSPNTPLLELGINKLEVVPDIGGILSFYNSMTVESFTEDQLVLAENCTDCYTHVFTKKD